MTSILESRRDAAAWTDDGASALQVVAACSIDWRGACLLDQSRNWRGDGGALLCVHVDRIGQLSEDES